MQTARSLLHEERILSVYKKSTASNLRVNYSLMTRKIEKMSKTDGNNVASFGDHNYYRILFRSP